jgi:hypothetical protein
MIALFLTTVFVLPSDLAQVTFIKPKAKADIDFESELWNAVSDLRGVSENQYKDYILSSGASFLHTLLFLRY